MEGTRLKISGANWEAGPWRRRLGTHHLEPEQSGFFSSSLRMHSSVSAQNDARRSKDSRRRNCWAPSGGSLLLPATHLRVTAVSPDNDCKKTLTWQGVPAESQAGTEE